MYVIFEIRYYFQQRICHSNFQLSEVRALLPQLPLLQPLLSGVSGRGICSRGYFVFPAFLLIDLGEELRVVGRKGWTGGHGAGEGGNVRRPINWFVTRVENQLIEKPQKQNTPLSKYPLRKFQNLQIPQLEKILKFS